MEKILNFFKNMFGCRQKERDPHNPKRVTKIFFDTRNGEIMKAFKTWVEVLQYVEENYSNPTALNRHNDKGWHALSTKEFIQAVKCVAVGLHQLGVKRGDRVGIVAPPSPEWTIADMAIIAMGAVAVPLFANISDENFVYEATETNLKVLFIEGDEQWQTFSAHEDLFKTVITIDERHHSKALSFKELVQKGESFLQRHPHHYEELVSGIQPEDVAAIIYTSGSTGTPKGVELTQYNLASVVNFSAFNWDTHKDRYLSVLPLAHVFGHCINLWLITWGISIYYSDDYKRLGMIAQEMKPTAMVVVPRLLEKVYAKMIDKVHEAHGLKRLIGEWAFAVARMEHFSWIRRLFSPLFNHLVYHKLREALGGKLRVVISGGAPLNPHLHQFFESIGIPIYEGWGLTEACPVCVNVPSKNKIGTVGPAVTGQQVRIAPDGEVLVKGTLVMRGYYKHPDATLEAITQDGWLHTGDRGKMDEDGYLTILGRMKELYKTSTGEYVAPVPIEQALGRYPLIDMAMVVAEGRKFTSCLLFPNMEVLTRMKRRQKADLLSDEDFLKSPFIRKEIDGLMNEINKHLNHWEQIHGYRFIMEPLTIQKGELTPSMKIRRDIVAKKYSREIDAIYREEAE